MVMGSSLGEPKLNFIFAKLSFGHGYERVDETLVAKGAGKQSLKCA